MPDRTTLSLVFICALLLISGCGQKGPLYMPDSKAANGSNPDTLAAKAITPVDLKQTRTSD